MLKTTIPFIDLRDKPMVDMLRAYPDKAEMLLKASRGAFGLWSKLASYPLLPLSDWRSHRWLKRTHNPYLHEIEAAADVLCKRGIYTLNLAYEWGCTSGAYLVGGQVQLLRVLDWPFPALGEHMVLALQKGPAGEFYNVTWPGTNGVFQGMAPKRFSAAINQAPMRKHGFGFAGDWIINRFIAWGQKGLPPAHLLRKVFEYAGSYDEAKDMLCKIPVAMPVIFVLAGLKQGQGCVIERLENSAEIKELSGSQIVAASNEFHSPFAGIKKGFRPRAIDSAGRYRQAHEITAHDLHQGHFSWLRPPILNIYTRVVMQADAASGALMVQGYEGQVAVTNAFAIGTASS